MIKEIKLGGKIVTAVILGDAIEHDPEIYRDSLLSVIRAALENQEALDNRTLTGTEVSDCIRLAKALEDISLSKQHEHENKKN